MNEKDLLKLLCKHMHGCHDHGVFACNNIRKPRKPCAYILNTDPHYKKGQHWVAIYIDRSNTGYYFDSYGLPPIKKEFVNFLQKHCRRWEYNDVLLQDPGSEACGEFCLYFLIHMSYGWSMENITDSLKNNDDIQVIEYVNNLSQ